MKLCYLAMRVQQVHKRDAIVEGFDALGYKQVHHPQFLIGDDVLYVTWNLHGKLDQTSKIIAMGGTVIVCENPYIKTDLDGKEYLAMAVNGHNGSGLTPQGEEDRLSKLGVSLEPWRDGGDHILVIGQRGIGSPTMKSPPRWGELTTEVLEQSQDLPIVHRPHPGRVQQQSQEPLEIQLDRAACIVMWASNCATPALLKGIPVFYNAPNCVLQKSCRHGLMVDKPIKSDVARQQAFWDLSYAQWNLDEIRSGEAFTRLIECKSLPQEEETPS